MKKTEDIFEKIADSDWYRKQKEDARSGHPDHEVLHAYVFGWLDNDETEKIRSHLFFCNTCAEEAALIKKLDQEILGEVGRKRIVASVQEWFGKAFSPAFFWRPALGFALVTVIAVMVYLARVPGDPFPEVRRTLDRSVMVEISRGGKEPAPWHAAAPIQLRGPGGVTGAGSAKEASAYREAFSLGVEVQRVLLGLLREGEREFIFEDLNNVAVRLKAGLATDDLLKGLDALEVEIRKDGLAVDDLKESLSRFLEGLDESCGESPFFMLGRWNYQVHQLLEAFDIRKDRQEREILAKEFRTLMSGPFLTGMMDMIPSFLSEDEGRVDIEYSLEKLLEFSKLLQKRELSEKRRLEVKEHTRFLLQVLYLPVIRDSSP